VDPSGESFDGAEPAWATGVVDCGPALPILLVVHPQGHGVGKEQIREWRSGEDNGSVEAAERDVLGPELDGPGARVTFRHSIFADS
jgi:hypothetical protein